MEECVLESTWNRGFRNPNDKTTCDRTVRGLPILDVESRDAWQQTPSLYSIPRIPQLIVTLGRL